MDHQIGLTPEQIIELTGFKRPKRQCLALASMAIPFLVRLNGKPFVAISAVNAYDPTNKRLPKTIVKTI